MKSKFSKFLKTSLFLSMLSSIPSFAEEAISYLVVQCNDGDTCRLKSKDNVSLKIRLIGIDSPEVASRTNKKSQPFGDQSKEFLNNLIKGKTVTLKNYATDAFGRNLSEIFLDKENVNLKLVQEGYAEVYQGKMDKNFDVSKYLDAEKKAKEKKVGIWSLKDYQSPKDFRKSKKEN